MEQNSTGISRFKSVQQMAESRSGFTASSLRWLIFNAKHNGLEQAIIRLGRKVLIDEPRFVEWIESHRDAKTASTRS